MNFKSVLIPAAAATGLVVSILALAGITLPCQTSGCSLYAGLKIAGISPYALGATGFAAILLCWLLARSRPGMQFLLSWLLLGGVAISSAFLLWQNLYWPCTTCLVVALAIGVAAGAARATIPVCRTRAMTAALVLWAVLFIPALLAAGKESLLTATPVHGSARAPVKIFFSPTCPACQNVVLEALENPGLAQNLALIPIAKDREDLRRLASHYALGTPIADLFRTAGDNPPPLTLRQRLDLSRNKMVLASMGATSVPVVIAPRLITPAPALPPANASLEEFYQSLFPDQYQLYEPGCDLQETIESSCSP
jgi:hypothetical protein